MPDDEVARPSADRLRSESVQVLAARIGAARRALQPRLGAAVEARHQRERALLGRRIGEVEDALHAERNRRLQADVPMRVRSREAPALALGHVEAGPVGGDPEVGGPPELREGLVDADRAAVRFERRVLEILHHDAVVAASVPRLRIVRLRAEMIPQRLRRGPRGCRAARRHAARRSRARSRRRDRRPRAPAPSRRCRQASAGFRPGRRSPVASAALMRASTLPARRRRSSPQSNARIARMSALRARDIRRSAPARVRWREAPGRSRCFSWRLAGVVRPPRLAIRRDHSRLIQYMPKARRCQSAPRR